MTIFSSKEKLISIKKGVEGFEEIVNQMTPSFENEMSNDMINLLEQWCIQQNITKFYRFDKHIGSGNFAEVYLAYHIQTDEVLAIKAIKIEKMLESNRNLASLINEIDSMRGLHHPHICRMHGLYEDSEYIYIVLDYCPAEDMF